MVARAPKEVPADAGTEVEIPPVDVESVDSTEMTEEEQADFEARALDLAETAKASPKAYISIKKSLIKYEPELIKRAEELLQEMLISEQKLDLVKFMIKKEDRPEGLDVMPLINEFLYCMNRGNVLGKQIFVTKESNSRGQGDGKNHTRTVSFNIGSEEIVFKSTKKIAGAKKKAVTVEETTVSVDADE